MVLWEDMAMVKAKSSTLEIISDLGISRWREETYMTNSKGEIGEPWGTPTETGVNERRNPWNVRRQGRSLSKEPTH